MGFWKTTYTSEQIVSMIQGSPEEREKALEFIYGNQVLRRKVRNVALYDSGNAQDADDLWHDVFMVADKKIIRGEFRGVSAAQNGDNKPLVASFMVGIARGIWANRKRKMRPESGLELAAQAYAGDDLEKWLLRREGRQILANLLAAMTTKCQHLLGLYNQYFSMREIRDTLSLPSEKRTNKEIDICRKKLRLYLQQHPELLDALDPFL